MYEWRRLMQIVVDEIDERIKCHDDDALTLQSLSKKLGYSEFHTTRKFKEISGMLLVRIPIYLNTNYGNI
jgi:AraC-like DNA-binding protein